MEQIWNNLKISEDGHITDLRGRPKKPDASGLVSFTSGNGGVRQRKKERIIYEVFSGHVLERAEIIEFVNGDKTDFRYENLRCVHVSEHRKKTEFKLNSRYFTRAEVAKICAEWDTGKYLKKELADKYSVGRTTLQRILTGGYKCRDEK